MRPSFDPQRELLACITAVIAAVIAATTALAEPLPVAKPSGPGGSCPFGYLSSGSLRSWPGRERRHRQVGERHLRVGMDELGVLLPAQRWVPSEVTRAIGARRR